MSETTYGGWIVGNTSTTGGSLYLIQRVGWMAAAGAVLSTVGTGGELSLERLRQNVTSIQRVESLPEFADAHVVRSPVEDLARIRKIISPAVSDLANTFGVSRQSIYNWQNGEPVSPENVVKLRDLAQAADVLNHEQITVNATFLRRKLSNGKTLLQFVQSGESARNAALLLVRICKREAMQRERMNARFANRQNTLATADFDLPPSNDLI